VVIVAQMQPCYALLCCYPSVLLYQVTYLPVKQNGLIDVAQLEAAIRPDTALVSVMAVNNEIGVIQPLKVLHCTMPRRLFTCWQCFGSLITSQASSTVFTVATLIIRVSYHRVSIYDSSSAVMAAHEYACC
jgi:Aminotransferase class-V